MVQKERYIPTIYTVGLKNLEGITTDHIPMEEYRSMIKEGGERIKEKTGLYSELKLIKGTFNVEEIEGEEYDYNASLKLYIPSSFPRIFFPRKDFFVVNMSSLVLRNSEGEIIRGPFYALRITGEYINILNKKDDSEGELESKIESIKSVFDEEGFFDVDPKADLLSLIQNYK